MNCFSEDQLSRISHLVREIEKLSDVEKLFLYLQLPCGSAEGSEAIEGKSSAKFNGSLKGPNSDLFAKKPDQETTQTYTWILSHLEVDPNVSLPKQEVYDEYRTFCQANRFEPLCVADFGKAMKHAFPCIKPRRLGQRGNSRYCYSGLRKKYKIQPPNLPDMMIEPTFCMDNDCSQAYNQIIKDCRDNPEECPLNKPTFTVNEVMNLKIEHNGHHQYPTNSTTTADTNSGSDNGYFNGSDDNSGKQSSHHHSQGQSLSSAAAGDGSRQRLASATGQANMTNLQMTPIVTGSSGHEYIPSNPIPINQPSSSSSSSSAAIRCSYSAMIKQPGTPDDDDYQHNYHQDVLPINRHLYSSTLNVPSSHQQQQLHHQHHNHHNQHHQHHSQQEAPTGEPFAQLHHHHHPSMKVSTNNLLATTANDTGLPGGSNSDNNQHMLQSSTSSFANDPLVSGNGTAVASAAPTTAVTSSAAMMNGCPEMLQFSHMNSSLIDSCASPFQSPASTPYHQMGNYMSPDIQDYYSTTNDCMRYSS